MRIIKPFIHGLLAFILLAPFAHAWEEKLLHRGSGANKIELVFIPSGFDSFQSFKSEVQRSLDNLWQNNFFNDHKQRFDAYMLTDQLSPKIKTDNEIVNLIKANDLCTYGSPECTKIHIVVQNEDGANESTGNFIRLRLEAKNYYTLAHELSVHVLGDLRPYGGPLMKDEYLNDASCLNYTYGFTNVHDRNSNEKWSNFVKASPYQGSAYCRQFYRPTENSIARGSNNRDCDVVGYRAAEIGLSKRTHDGSRYDERIKPAVIVKQDANVITVKATDDSGIERVEFYLSKDGAEFRTAAIDWSEPYSHALKMECGSEYWVRIYVFDRAWNMFGHPDKGAQIGPFRLPGEKCAPLPASSGTSVTGFSEP